MVEAWDDGGGAWVELGRLQGTGTDSAYLSASYDISAYASANTIIRFSTSGFAAGSYVYLDNVQIDETAIGGGALLFVVTDPAAITSEESLRKSLVESWGYAVTLIDDSASQAAYDSAVASHDVAYISEEITSTQLASKLRGAAIGVVNEERMMHDDLGFSDGVGDQGDITSISIVDNTHEITSAFALGNLEVVNVGHTLQYVHGTTSPDLKMLAEHPSSPNAVVAILDAGDALHGGGTAAGRRVWMPWGQNEFQFASLTADGQTLLRRALNWAGGLGMPSDLVAHWKLDDATGATALDSAGNHDGILINAPSWLTSGQLDGALELDGVDDYVDVGSFDVAGSGITMLGWFNADTFNDDPRIVSKASGSQEIDAWWQLSAFGSGTDQWLRMRIKAGGTTTTLIDSTVSLQTDTWYLAAATYNNATGDMTLYLDGAEVATGLHAVGGALDADASVPVAIGANGDAARFFDGTLDDIRVYNRPLSAAEIADLFTAGGGGSTSDGTGTYRDEFNTNGSFAGNDGTLSWSTDWLEIGESDGAGAGDIATINDASQYQLQIRDSDFGNSEGVEREANLSACATASLTFTYRRDGLDNSDDFVTIDVSGDGGASWAELGRLQGSATDASYQLASYDLSTQLATNTRIRFLGSSTLGNTDTVYFDDVEIDCQ